jgi:hypothetical protein
MWKKYLNQKSTKGYLIRNWNLLKPKMGKSFELNFWKNSAKKSKKKWKLSKKNLKTNIYLKPVVKIKKKQ